MSFMKQVARFDVTRSRAHAREAFRARVYQHFYAHGRCFPWRMTRNPYRILVSEIMLQQTQAGARTVGKYEAFLERFPTVHDLAAASLSEVLALWQGLGYNRRAKALRDSARDIVERHGGRVPRARADLEALPGVGPYTAAAVLVFAFNQPSVVLETNIRTAFIHDFFKEGGAVHDKDIIPLVEATLDRNNPRQWYQVLMDYGASLKKKKGNASRRSAHYAKQSPFKGSARQVRGSIIRLLVRETKLTARALAARGNYTTEEIAAQLARLTEEGLVTKEGKSFMLA